MQQNHSDEKKPKKKFINEKMNDAKGDSNKCWKLLNYITCRKKVKTVTEPEMMTQTKADKYNTYFATIGVEIQKQLGIKQDYFTIKDIEHGNFKFSEEKQATIEKLIDNIKIDVATGGDNVGARLIKDVKSTISPVLTKIINKGYELSIFPDCMKKQLLNPYIKKKTQVISQITGLYQSCPRLAKFLKEQQ